MKNASVGICAALMLAGCALSRTAPPPLQDEPASTLQSDAGSPEHTSEMLLDPTPTSGDHPPHIRAFPNGFGVVHTIPTLPVLNGRQEATLLAAIAALPAFSPYIYSGCHDRAHAIWMLLPENLKGSVAKVWLFAPSATTLAFRDSLTLPAMGDDSPRWGYHVALVFRNASGMRVLDAARENWSSTPITLTEWLDSITTPYGTVMTTLAPELYLFYALKNQNTSLTNNPLSDVVNNGQFFPCTGDCKTDGNIETALARDDIGAKLATQGGCAYLLSELRKPGNLLTKLTGSDAPPECSTLMSEFAERRGYWRQILWGTR